MKTAHYAISLLGTAGLAKRSLNDNARLTQLIGKSLDKYILPADKQWRQYWIVVIPTPSASERIAVLHRLVGIDISAYSVDTHLTNALNEGTHVVVVEARVESAHAIYVASKSAVGHLTSIAQFCLEPITATKLVDGGNSCQHLHCGCRTHQLTLIVGIECRVGIKVVYHQSHLRSAEHVVLKQLVEMQTQIVLPRQGMLLHSEGVGHERVFLGCVVIYFYCLLCLCSANGEEREQQGVYIACHIKMSFILVGVSPLL